MIIRLFSRTIFLVLFSIQTGHAADSDSTLAARQQLNTNLIEHYQGLRERPQTVEKIEFLERNGSLQPITVIHNSTLIPSNRVLVIAMDDNARVLSTAMEDTVIIGVPMADRIRDLVPPTPDDVKEGSPEWDNAQITDPDSDAMIEFIKEQLIPYAEENYGPFFHKMLFGYSLGGIFTLQTLMSEPELFDSYIAGSPSLWYRYDYYEALAIAASEQKDRFQGRCLVLSAGEDEPSISVGARKYERLLTGLGMPLIIHHQRNLETDHGHNRTLSFLYGWDRIFNIEDEFLPKSMITASTLDEFHEFVSNWLGNSSCVAHSPMRSASAYSVFAGLLAERKDYSEMRLLYNYARESMPLNSRTFGSVLFPLLGSFTDMPVEEKQYWANNYSEFLNSSPAPAIGIHYLNKDVIEFLDSQ